MISRRGRAVSAAALAFLASTQLRAQSTAQQPAARWWHDITVLADDSMRGRYTGSEDYLKAAHYVAQQFQSAGLAPGGADGYFQTVHLATALLVPDSSGIVLERDGATDTLHIGSDASVQVKPYTETRAQGPLVFVGYGLHLPGAYDDIGNADLHGKVVVYLNRLPRGLNATMLAHGRASRWIELQRLGAVAGIAISDPPPPGRAAVARTGGAPRRPALGLADDPANHGMLITLRGEAAEKLFDGSGHTYAEMLALSDAGKPLPVVALQPRMRAWLDIQRSPVDAPNVVGIMRGTDPTLRDQYLVVSAHLDHLGVGRAVNGDSIYNGAMDNASGIATLLETAREFHDRNVHTRRSVIFLAVTGEEEGRARLRVLRASSYRAGARCGRRSQHRHVSPDHSAHRSVRLRLGRVESRHHSRFRAQGTRAGKPRRP